MTGGFFYPRTVTISRQAVAAGGGVQAYGGAAQACELVLFSDLSASIQFKGTAARADARLPADAADRTLWRVTIPLAATSAAGISAGSILRGDIVTDDTGVRHLVIAPYITPLGAQLLVERLEA